MMKQILLCVLAGTFGLLTLAPTLCAQACYNSAVAGAYGFVGSRAVAAAATTGTGMGGTGTSTGTGSTGAPTVSATPIGVLLGDMSGTTGFGVVGVLFFDGAGNISATATAAMNQTTNQTTNKQTQVGTYSVNQDCTITMTVSDVFLTATGMPVTTPGGGGGGRNTSSTPLTATFEGVVLGGGSAIDLAEAGPTTGVTVELRKMIQTTGCTNARFAGTYGFMAQVFSGLPLSAPGTNGSTETPSATFPTVARFFADGAGNVTVNNVAPTSSSSNRQLTGTYTVNSDCTGTATLTSSSGVNETADFVLVQSVASQTLGGVCASSTVVSPEVLFEFTTAGVQGISTALPLQ
jgi:hypothetical protein